MYAPTSTSLPRSGPTSGDDDGLADFDGAGEILRSWGSGLRPDPDLTVSEWADRHRMLSSRASAEPGRYRTARTPYMREIMDRLSPGDATQRIVFMKAAQVGATEAGNNWIGFLTLLEAPVRAIAGTDTFTIRAGCDKRIATCGTKFANVANFRGFPDIPGQDAVLRYATTDGGHKGAVL
jgi:hypothetical protein